MAALTRESEIKKSNIFTRADITNICVKLKLTRDAETMIDVLRTENYILYKGNQTYKLQTV